MYLAQQFPPHMPAAPALSVPTWVPPVPGSVQTHGSITADVEKLLNLHPDPQAGPPVTAEPVFAPAPQGFRAARDAANAPVDQAVAVWYRAADPAAFQKQLLDSAAMSPVRRAEFERRVKVIVAFRESLAALVGSLVSTAAVAEPQVAEAARAYTRRCLKKLYQGTFDMACHWAPEWLLRKLAPPPTGAAPHAGAIRLRREVLPALQATLQAWSVEVVIDYMVGSAHDFYTPGEPFYRIVEQQKLKTLTENDASFAVLKKRLRNTSDFLAVIRDMRSALERDFPKLRGFINEEVSRRMNDALPYLQKGVPFQMLYRGDHTLRSQLKGLSVPQIPTSSTASNNAMNSTAAPLSAEVQEIQAFFSSDSGKNIVSGDLADGAYSGSGTFKLTQGLFRFRSETLGAGLQNILKYGVPGMPAYNPIAPQYLRNVRLDYGLTRNGRRPAYNYVQEYQYEHPPKSGKYIKVELWDILDKSTNTWVVYYRTETEPYWAKSPFARTPESIREASRQMNALSSRAIAAYRMFPENRAGPLTLKT